MKCIKCGHEITMGENYKPINSTMVGLQYLCEKCNAEYIERYPHRQTPSIEERVEKLENRVTELEEENNMMRYLIDDLVTIFESIRNCAQPLSSTYRLLGSLNTRVNEREEKND